MVLVQLCLYVNRTPLKCSLYYLIMMLYQVGEEAQKSVIQRIFQQVAQRPDSFCNYLEGIIPEWGEGTKLIYRHYATLYFVFAVDSQESDLGILDLVQGETFRPLIVLNYRSLEIYTHLQYYYCTDIAVGFPYCARTVMILKGHKFLALLALYCCCRLHHPPLSSIAAPLSCPWFIYNASECRDHTASMGKHGWI